MTPVDTGPMTQDAERYRCVRGTFESRARRHVVVASETRRAARPRTAAPRRSAGDPWQKRGRWFASAAGRSRSHRGGSTTF